MRSKAATQKGLFLVIDGEMEIPQQTFSARREGDEFGVILGEVRTADIRGRFDPLVQSVLVGLSLPPGSFGFTKIGGVIYLNEVGSTKPIYVSDIVFGKPKLTIPRALSSVEIETARASASKFISDNVLSRPVGLLKTSLDTATDELQGFIAAWSALEFLSMQRLNRLMKSAGAKFWKGGPRHLRSRRWIASQQ